MLSEYILTVDYRTVIFLFFPFRAAWAAGTGYGSDYSRSGVGSAPIWDAKHAEASQAAQDAELEKLLIELAAGGSASKLCYHIPC